MGKEKKNRDTYIDAVKGLGILSIVIGHASWTINIMGIDIQIGPFVYLYHLAIFAFCSGYLFNENISDFWLFVGKKLKGLYRPFVIYSLMYFVVRNIFIYSGTLQAEKFTLDQGIITLTNVLTFNSMGEMLGAFWFVPMLFFALIFYAAIVFYTKNIRNKKVRECLRCICYCVFGAVGIYTTERQFGLLFNIQISYLMVPIIAIGHYFKIYGNKKNLNIAGMLAAALIMIYVLSADYGIIELSKYMILNRWLFYPVTVCGIYFCLSFTKFLSRCRIVEKAMSIMGQYSFDIMAMHFIAFKVVDFIACKVTNHEELLGVFPHSFIDLWPIYYIVGILLPIMLKKIYNMLKLLLIS